jgi:hypothetical protein
LLAGGSSAAEPIAEQTECRAIIARSRRDLQGPDGTFRELMNATEVFRPERARGGHD